MAVLETYHQKRDFSKTREPKGSKGKKAGNSFVIQKHDATRLHYDLRLEMDGVMKSWAVTRGPSLVPAEKRLAVHVEDHPIEYNAFEGTIPKGEYGGGTVIIWDRGYWTPVDDAAKGYQKGHLEFELHGEKLHGRWHLVRMQRKPREKRENWLLIKSEDDAARDASDPDILEERPESVKTGRVIDEVAGEEPGWSSKTGKISGKKRHLKSPKTPASKTEQVELDPSELKGSKRERCRASLSQPLPRCHKSHPQAQNGFTRSSLMATDCRRISMRGRSSFSPGLAWTGRQNSARNWFPHFRRCLLAMGSSMASSLSKTPPAHQTFPLCRQR